MEKQNFKNHAKFVPLFHFITFPLAIISVIAATINLISNAHLNWFTPILLLSLSLVSCLLSFFSRKFSLVAQDRVIRAEQNFRHYIATGKELDSNLLMGQIIALRFAGDDEFVGLAKKAVADNMTSKEIKMAIQNWKVDFYRV